MKIPPRKQSGWNNNIGRKVTWLYSKRGFQEVKEVLDYGDRMSTKGLHLLNGPEMILYQQQRLPQQAAKSSFSQQVGNTVWRTYTYSQNFNKYTTL